MAIYYQLSRILCIIESIILPQPNILNRNLLEIISLNPGTQVINNMIQPTHCYLVLHNTSLWLVTYKVIEISRLSKAKTLGNTTGLSWAENYVARAPNRRVEKISNFGVDLLR